MTQKDGAGPRHVLFLQGPLSELYSLLGERLRQEGIRVSRINFNIGDALFWRAGGARAFKGKKEAWRGFIARYLDQNAVTDLVLHGDQRFYHRIAIEEALVRGVYVAVSELGLLRPDWTTFERNGTSVQSHFPEDPAAIRAIAEAAPAVDFKPLYKTSFRRVAVPDMVYNLLNTALWFLSPHYQRHTPGFPPVEYMAHGLRMLGKQRRERAVALLLDHLKISGQPVFLVPLQLDGDFQIRANSPYSNMAEALEEIVNSFHRAAPQNAVLLVKSHPLDDGTGGHLRTLRALAHGYGLAGRLHFADGGDLMAMAAIARGAVTVNSTAGLELMMRGVPVKTLAPAIFDIQGLTDPKKLDLFWNQPHPVNVEMLAVFIKAIAATIQVRGTIYDERGIRHLVDTMSERLIFRLCNEPLGFVDKAPRRKKLDDLLLAHSRFTLKGREATATRSSSLKATVGSL